MRNRNGVAMRLVRVVVRRFEVLEHEYRQRYREVPAYYSKTSEAQATAAAMKNRLRYIRLHVFRTGVAERVPC